MKPIRITLIQGHPDARVEHFCHALADAYVREARSAGHEVRCVEVARLNFPILRGQADWEAALPATLTEAQESIRWADHLVFIFPLWLGTLPALLKAFLEQILRPGFGFARTEVGKGSWRKGLAGKSARLIVTMGMPALIYRWYFMAHGVKGLERSILKFCGINPVRETLIGMIEQGEAVRRRALEKVRGLGRAGQ